MEQAFCYSEQEQVVASEGLSVEEKTVYHQLGPVYQKIYLFALTAEMRRRVVIYVCRGLTAFEAVNVILRAEQRKFESVKQKRTLTPCERSIMQKKRSVDVTG